MVRIFLCANYQSKEEELQDAEEIFITINWAYFYCDWTTIMLNVKNTRK